jgi:hypothetical protein
MRARDSSAATSDERRLWCNGMEDVACVPIAPAARMEAGASDVDRWAHYSGGYRDRLLDGPQGPPDLGCRTPDGVKHKAYRGIVLG